jgi:hypothetical protein
VNRQVASKQIDRNILSFKYFLLIEHLAGHYSKLSTSMQLVSPWKPLNMAFIHELCAQPAVNVEPSRHLTDK